MTNGALEKNAYHYNQGFLRTFYSLFVLSMGAAIGGVVAILNDNEPASAICAIIAIGLFAYTLKAPRAMNKKEILSAYITHTLENASNKRHLELNQKLRNAEVNLRLQMQKMGRLMRNQHMIRGLPISQLVAKNKAEITACEQSVERAIRREAAMRAELNGFIYELSELVKKANGAITAHLASKEESLLEKTEFARTINGLVQNASEL